MSKRACAICHNSDLELKTGVIGVTFRRYQCRACETSFQVETRAILDGKGRAVAEQRLVYRNGKMMNVPREFVDMAKKRGVLLK